MTTAAIYARVSSEIQRLNNSITIQKRVCLEYAERQGFIVAPEHEFVDVFTGTSLDRPEFTKLVALAGRVDAVIFHVFDRFSRDDALDAVQQIRQLEKQGTQVHLTNRGRVDTQDDMSLLFILLEAQAAKKERDAIIRRTTDARYERARKGKISGCKCSFYGYHYDSETGTLGPNPGEAPWVAKIYEWHGLEKVGFATIANRLMDLNVPTKLDNL